MIDERYITYLDKEYLLFSLLTARDTEKILELEELFKDALSWDLEPSTEHLDGRSYLFTVQDKRVITLKMPGLDEFVFSKFPEPIVNLTALRTLFLSNNLINRIPESVRKLFHLENLYLMGANLTDFPSVICNIKSLKKIDFSFNRIQSIPDSIRN